MLAMASAESRVKFSALTSPNWTAVTLVKSMPVMVTVSPPASLPLFGETTKMLAEPSVGCAVGLVVGDGDLLGRVQPWRGLPGIYRRAICGIAEKCGAAIGQEECEDCEQPCRRSTLALVAARLGHESRERGTHQRSDKLELWRGGEHGSADRAGYSRQDGQTEPAGQAGSHAGEFGASPGGLGSCREGRIVAA